jgi:hypothetical protein
MTFRLGFTNGNRAGHWNHYCNVSGRSTRGETPDRLRCDAQAHALHRTAKDGDMARSCEPDRLSLEHGVGYGTVIGCADR